MNVIINSCKRATTGVAVNFLKNGSLPREYASVGDYNIFWKRPEKVPCWVPEKSGDLGLDVGVKPTDFCYKYGESSEMKDANDIVKKMFTLEFQPRKKTVAVKREKMLELVRRHSLDRGSPESLIAILTCQILHFQEYIKDNPKHSSVRIILKEMIDKRRQYLSDLRRWDYRRFEWILEKLNLVYKPFPSAPSRVERKASMRRLTEKHCNKLVQDKLDAYKMELKELQKDFYKEKAEKLAFIREEELACGLQPSVSEQDVENARQKAKEYET